MILNDEFRKFLPVWILTVICILAANGAAQTPAVSKMPVTVAADSGKVVSVDAEQHKLYYEEWHFAPARVEGDLVFVSGFVVRADSKDNVALDEAGYKTAVRKAFAEINALLEAAGSSKENIVDLTTFHLFGSPLVKMSKREQINAFRRVKDEFIKPPYPAWTGIGAAELFPDNGLIEIKVVARLSKAKAK